MRFLLISLIVLTMFATPLIAGEVSMQELGHLSLASSAKQIVVAPDGSRFYVLTQDGQIQLYGPRGLEGGVKVGPEVSSISPFGGNQLLLLKNDGKEVSVVSLDPVVKISKEGAIILGNPDAPVSIYVFDDFECPYCAQAAPLLKQAQALYPNKVNLVFKNFPLSIHKHARQAALAGLAAERQGKFWDLYDLLFKNHKNLSDEMIDSLAKQVGMDMEKFKKDIKDPSLEKQITEDMREGQQIGVRGTPAIYINGRPLQNRSLQGFKQMIDAELAKL